jgi:hypothetical protein
MHPELPACQILSLSSLLKGHGNEMFAGIISEETNAATPYAGKRGGKLERPNRRLEKAERRRQSPKRHSHN